MRKSKKKFIEDYQILVLQALEELKKRFSLMAPMWGAVFETAVRKKEEHIKEEGKLFKEETIALLDNLELCYDKTFVHLDALVVEGTTKKIFIPYHDKNTNTSGVKVAGKYLVVISAEMLKNSSISIEDIVTIKRLGKRLEKFIHPHINFETRKSCWGDLREPIKSLLQEASFLESMLYAHAFLNRSNLDSCYSKADFLELPETSLFPGKPAENSENQKNEETEER